MPDVCWGWRRNGEKSAEGLREITMQVIYLIPRQWIVLPTGNAYFLLRYHGKTISEAVCVVRQKSL